MDALQLPLHASVLRRQLALVLLRATRDIITQVQGFITQALATVTASEVSACTYLLGLEKQTVQLVVFALELRFIIVSRCNKERACEDTAHILSERL